ncbi:sodium- and chloride-dependent transporter XTRP3-like, partial [Phodopus roborovskii]|uniref:sodium- and chloride-dependent transporter XTRP3-like n=1 Tax=Phodopus roborovskii TaxID=109678 RepID=UPI0021E4D5EA
EFPGPLVMLIVEGMLLLYLELAVGQRMRQGSIGAWRCPYLSGVGVASVVVSSFLSMYYNVINAWGFWYLFHSFQDPLLWSVCPLNGNRTGYDEEYEKASSMQYFWCRKTLNISPSIQENGGVQWEPALCLILAWLMVYLCILRGTESTSKVKLKLDHMSSHPSHKKKKEATLFESDLQAMTCHSLNWYWKAMWAFVSPILIISLYVFYLSDYILSGTLQYQAWDGTQGQLVTKDYPPHAPAVIGLLVASSTMCITLLALGIFIWNCLKRGGSSPVV